MMLPSISALKDAIEEDIRLQVTVAILRTLVLTKQTRFYSEVAPLAGFHHRDVNFHRLLGRTMELDVAAKRPPMCSLVINKELGRPGGQYFTKATMLGLNVIAGDEYLFWCKQLFALGVSTPSYNSP